MMMEKQKIMPDFCNLHHRFHYITALNLLAGLGININRVNLLAVGTHKNYRGEVHEQSPSPGTSLTNDTEIILKVGCASAVDHLPYQFFYGLQGRQESDSSWEEEARALMAPYDAAYIRFRARAEFQALKYEFGVLDSEHLRRILDLFGFSLPESGISADEILFWISVLPAIYMWGGNSQRVMKILSNVLGLNIRIVENVEAESEIPDGLRYRLASKTGRLGCETVLGNSFTECDSTCEVVIDDLPPERVGEFLPGKSGRKRLKAVLDYCMPGELDRRISVRVDRGRSGYDKVYLGYSTYI